MIIETPDGKKREEVEETLQQYGLVVTGKMKPEAFLQDPFAVQELKSQLGIAHLQLEQKQELLQIAKSNRYKTRKTD